MQGVVLLQTCVPLMRPSCRDAAVQSQKAGSLTSSLHTQLVHVPMRQAAGSCTPCRDSSDNSSRAWRQGPLQMSCVLPYIGQMRLVLEGQVQPCEVRTSWRSALATQAWALMNMQPASGLIAEAECAALVSSAQMYSCTMPLHCTAVCGPSMQ
jgi:hypothetical protein